ncbi:hypothetical protein HHK36_000421 [Tetracentron sinense]|uniref:Transmembrane protein n=1 Tax=Tetracentron sinense TaxID=13715 RepID=A0A835DTZ8_TETSI|nr:hypothetical protein HHK36_000421 [Tetracentron sinense]
MHRSSSTTRASEEFFVHASLDGDELPSYNPLSDVAKKEKSRARSAENAVHLIPFVLVLCAFVLWFFSHPAVDMVKKGDSIVPRIEGLTIDGNLDSDGTQTGLLPNLELEDFDAPKQMADHKATKFRVKKSE